MKKILPVAIVVGVLSLVACSSLASCDNSPICLDESPMMANVRRANDYSDNPYCSGMFDVVDYSTQTISRRTGYIDLDDLDGLESVYAVRDDYFVTVTLTAPYIRFYGTYDGIAVQRGYGFSNIAKWNYSSSIVSTDDGYNYLWFLNSTSSTDVNLMVRRSALSETSFDALNEYVVSEGGIHIQYLIDDDYWVDENLSDVMNGDNCADAYEEGSEDGYGDGYDVGYQAGYGLFRQRITFSVQSDLSDVEVYIYQDGDLVNTLTSGSSVLYGDDLSLVDGFSWNWSIGFNVDEYNGYPYLSISTASGGLNIASTDELYLPWWEGNVTIDILFSDSPSYTSDEFSLYFDSSALSSVNVGLTYTNGYNAGYQSGYNVGYEAGYTGAFASQDQGVYIQWSTSSSSNRTFSISWASSDETISGSYTLSYSTPTAYFNRPSAKTISLTITADNAVPFRVEYSSVSSSDFQTISADMAVDGVYYLPTWEGSVTLTIYPQDTDGSISSYDFAFDPSSVSNVSVSNGYLAGYDAGYEKGNSEGYDSGYDEGYANGKTVGYDAGYDEGWRVGYNEGQASVSEGGLVVSNIFGAVVGVPIDILNGLSGLTIWSIPLISVLMSFMFLGLVLWVVKKFI